MKDAKERKKIDALERSIERLLVKRAELTAEIVETEIEEEQLRTRINEVRVKIGIGICHCGRFLPRQCADCNKRNDLEINEGCVHCCGNRGIADDCPFPIVTNEELTVT